MNARLKIGTILAGAALAISTLGGISTASAGGEAAVLQKNLLTNGALMPTTNGWAKVGEGTFSSVHFHGATLINTKETLDDSSIAGYQCLNLSGENWTHTLKGSLRVQPDQQRSGSAYVIASYYDKAGCSGPNIDSKTSQVFTETDGWTDIQMNLTRTNGKKAKSMAVVLMVEKDSTNRFIFKGKPFAAQFRNFLLTGDPKGGAGQTHEEPGNDAACTDVCAEDDDLPVPVPPTGDAPTLQPIEPAAPVEPEAPAEPAAPVEPGAPAPAQPDSDEFPSDDDSGDDAPAETPTGETPSHDSPAGSPSQPSTTNNPSNNGSGNPSSNPGSSNGGAPAKPTLEPQGPGPINAATPTPGAPATGGDSTSDPADGLTNGAGDSSEVARSEKGDPMPVFAAAAMASALGFIGLAMVFKRRRRS